MPELDVKGRTAVVTGGSRGIGAVLARVFAERGMNVGVCSRSRPVLESGEGVVAMQVDVTDEAGVERFTEGVEARFGEIHLWVNNAGVLDPIAPVRDIEVADFRKHIDINLTGAFIGTRAFIRHRRARGPGGVLINISSGAAWSAYAGWGTYCAGKAGLERFTEVVALEEASAGLRAHSVAPGVVDTDMQELIRGCSEELFPEVERFRQLKIDDGFNSGEYVARELLAIAFDTTRRPEEVAVRLEYEEG
jgi:NAD(P)-dependent dehydrogenase (short-subunit alcohol dehydrogenase family)